MIMDRGAWKAAVHGVTKSRTRLSNFTFTFHFHALEKEMATHSSVLAWRIPGTGEPGGLPSMGSHRVRQDWSNLAAAEVILLWGLSLFPLGLIPCLLHRLREEDKSGAASALCQRSSGLQTRTPEVTFTKGDKGKRRCFSLPDLTSFLMTVFRSILISTDGVTPFLFIAEYYSIVYMYHIFFSHSSADGHLGCFPVYSIN